MTMEDIVEECNPSPGKNLEPSFFSFFFSGGGCWCRYFFVVDINCVDSMALVVICESVFIFRSFLVGLWRIPLRGALFVADVRACLDSIYVLFIISVEA